MISWSGLPIDPHSTEQGSVDRQGVADGPTGRMAAGALVGEDAGVRGQKGTTITPIPARRPSSSKISKRGFMPGSLLQFGDRDAVALVTA